MLQTYALKLFWNYLVPELISTAPVLTYTKAFALFMMCQCLFGKRGHEIERERVRVDEVLGRLDDIRQTRALNDRFVSESA